MNALTDHPAPLIDETSGIQETDAAAHRPYPKLKVMDALVTAAIFICLGAYLVIGGMWLFFHL